MCVGEKSLANSLVLEPRLRPILWRVYPNEVRETGERRLGGRGKEEGSFVGYESEFMFRWKSLS